jgi:hypothetical protein
MPADKSRLLDRLTMLTGDLRAVAGASPKTLEQARLAVARAVASPEHPEPYVRAASVRPAIELNTLSAEHRAGIEAAVDAVIGKAAEASPFLVARREVPLQMASIHGDMPDWTAGRAIDSSLGPFLDSVGRPVWIDLFQIVKQTRLVRSPGATPFLTLPLQDLTTTKNHFTLPAGSVWIASQQIAAGAPAGSYTGLLIKGGTLSFSNSLPVAGGEIVVPAAVSCTLELTLDPGTAPSGTGPGEDARRSSADVPKSVTFVFSSSGAKITSVAKASLKVYGSTVKLEPTTDPPVYVEDAARIFVVAKTTARTFAVNDVQSDELLPAGSAEIRVAAWTLFVAIVSPASLGNAAGAGGLALILNDGLTLRWKGQKAAAPAGRVTLIVDTGLVTLLALKARSLGAHETIPLWSKRPGEPHSSQVDLRWPARFPLRFFSGTSGVELLMVFGSLKANFDRPVTVTGKRVFLQSKNALILYVASGPFTGVILEAILDPPPAVKALAFAIANSVFRTTPATTLLLVAGYDGVQSPAGGVAIEFGLQFLIPTLPDPYAGNINVPWDQLRERQTFGALDALVFWSPAGPPLLTYTFPSNAVAATADAAPVTAPVTAPVPAPAAPVTAPIAEAPVKKDGTTAAAATGQTGGLIMLDLSTNVDRFGVAWFGSSRQTVAVESMYLVSPSRSVYIVTVPAVQWEPVHTETQLPAPSPPFPTLVTFADNGGPTAIGVQSVQLVRIAPKPALDFLVANFTTAPVPQPAAARFTLPFGIEAFSTLKKPGAAGARGATIDYNCPKFADESVHGGYQISIRAVDPAAPDSPSLEGSTAVRTDNLRQSGLPLPTPPPPRSVLDTDVDGIFNDYFAAGKKTAQVPVTRLDLSGYGESLFSRWVNPADNAVAVSQARFDVLVGRTSLEVVQVRSILYPYAVRVVRTITIQRKNSGIVARRDSGWQASTDGEYHFPGVGMITHPGVVQRIRNVTNIRDTGQILHLTSGAEMAGVVFDGDLVIENAVKGSTPAGVPARGQIGYVQLKPTGETNLTPQEYADLIEKAGPMGGNIDCTFNVGNSGQLMKLGRVGVGVTAGGDQFVMTAWGSPQFPQGGQWSFLRQKGAGTAPEVVDKALGIPLVRAGAAPAPPPMSSPYRFADPGDLSTPDTPRSDYGIVHATGTQRVFFPRPKIEGGTNKITSTQTPILADPYSLANSVGYFPRLDAAIPFPDANYALAIAGGNYHLELPRPSFPVTIGQRTISEAAGVRTYVDYAGSTATVVIDTAKAVPWNFELRDVAFATSAGLLKEVMRMTSTVSAAADIITSLAKPNLTFGSALGVVQKILVFLEKLGFPMPLHVSMTNKLEIKAFLKIPLDEELNKFMPPGGPEFDDTDVTVSLVIGSPLAEAEFEFGATMLIPTPFDPLKAVGRIDVAIKMSTGSGTNLTLTAGAGLGVSFNVAGFGCKAYFLETMFLIAGDTAYGFGCGLLIKGSIDLEVISVDVSVEAKMAILMVNAGGTCTAVTIFGVAQVTFAVEVSICWVIDIDFSVSSEVHQNLNGGPCALPDVL